MDEAVNPAEIEGLFSKRSSSNILSDPRILEHLRIVAEEAQSSEKNVEDTETDMAANRRELAEKIASYNKRNQLGAFRLVMKEDLNFEGALRFYFEDGNEKLTKAVRLTNSSLVADLLPNLIEKFKPDLDQSTLVRKAKLYEIHDEFRDKDRAAVEICLDPSDNPLDIALNAKQPPRFVLRLEYDKPTSPSQLNGAAKQPDPREGSLNSSITSVRSAGSDGSSTSGSTQTSKDHVGSPLSRFSPTKGSLGTPTSSRKGQAEERPSSASSDRSRNIFKNATSPRAALGMFFDGVNPAAQQDRSAHHAKASRGKRQRKRSFGSLLKLKKGGSSKKNVELSTNHLAPGILKVFGGHVSPGANYKSVRATDQTSADEIAKEALERYKLGKIDSKDYVLCDVVGYFTGADNVKREDTSDKPASDSERWITEYSRVIGDKEKPLVLQQLWKPITGFSRRFELRRKIETQDSSFFQARGSVAVVKAASFREIQLPPMIKEAHIPRGSTALSNHYDSFVMDEGSSSTRPSVVISPFLPPTDTPYLLLIRGYAITDDFLYHRLDEQIALIGRHGNAPGSVAHGDEHADHNPDINLFSPDVLPHHCVLSKKVESDGDLNLEEECDVNFVVCLEPNKNAVVELNAVPVSSSIKLSPGDLISIGIHYIFMFKDPTQVLDSSLQLHWMTVLQRFHEMSKNLTRSVSETDTIASETSLGTEDEADGRKLRLAFEAEDEDRLLDMIIKVTETREVYELTPSYLLIMCIEHSSRHHTDSRTRQLMLKISNSIQTVAWEKTSEMSNTIEKDTPPDKAMSDLLPQLNIVIFWMANCLEMHHFLQSNISHYLSNASTTSSQMDETLVSADEELLVCLEEVVMYTFQQTVYHLTKVLYVALPVILDTNPFQFDDDDVDDTKRPHEIDIVINVFDQTHEALRKYNVHKDITHQLFAYLFFFTNASLFNTLMERGAGGKFYRWAKGAQIRGNLDALEGWASQVELQEEYVHYLTRLSTAADLLATPKVQLLQADWMSIRRDFPALNAAQVQQILGEYQLGAGKSRPRGWFPPPEEVEPALRTADILLSFSEHPPLSLPTSGFVLDMENGPENDTFYQYLDMVRRSVNSGFNKPAVRNIEPSTKTTQHVEPVVPLTSVETSPQYSSLASLDDLDDLDVPSVTVSPPTPKPTNNRQGFQVTSPKESISSPPKSPRSVPPPKLKSKPETRPDRPVPIPRNRDSPVMDPSHSPKPHKSPQPIPRAHKREEILESARSPKPHGRPSSGGNFPAISPRGVRKSDGSASSPTVSPRESVTTFHGRTGSVESSASNLSSFGTRDENQNVSKSPKVRKESGSYKNERTKWVEVNGAGMAGSLNGLSVLPVEENDQENPEGFLENKEIQNDPHVNDKLAFLSQLQINEIPLSHVSDDVEGGTGTQRQLEGMRDGNDPQDDVFIVELEKSDTGLGLGLIDGLYTPLRSPGIYVRTLVQGGAAEMDGRLRLGDRILAVNGTSLVGADYQSAMQEIRQAGEHLSFLVAKSDIHVAMKITASSC